MQKNITIAVNQRVDGEIISRTEANGTTEDEGVTCVIPLGYVPYLGTADPADVELTVHQPATVHTAPVVESITPDTENNIQTVVFDLS